MRDMFVILGKGPKRMKHALRMIETTSIPPVNFKLQKFQNRGRYCSLTFRKKCLDNGVHYMTFT